jgi:hypothetical protein
MDISLHLNSVIENISKPSDNQKLDKNSDNKNLETDVEIKKHNYSNKLENFMNNTVIDKYARKWSRLETKLKQNKIKEFLDLKCEEFDINNKEKQNLLDILNSKLRLGQLNKLSEIIYDPENQTIKEIKKLKFGNNSYTFN